MNLNKAFVLGNVTRDPEVRTTLSGKQIASFGLATNRFYTDPSGQKKQDAEFHNIVCFGRLADISSRYLVKGSLVLIEGRIKTREWQDTSGIRHFRTEIIAENLQLGPKSVSSGSGQYNKSSFVSQEPNSLKPENIPVIEENYSLPDSNDNRPKNNPEEEIDVKNIPF